MHVLSFRKRALTLRLRFRRGVIGFVSMAMVATLLAVGSTLATQVPSAEAGTCPPQITSVSAFAAGQSQTGGVTITGTCFGTAPTGTSYTYNGDSAYFAITDPYPDGSYNWWQACTSNDPYGPNYITCSVTTWTNTSITFSGFTGGYADSGTDWVVTNGDPLVISVWNAQGGQGPANCPVTVGAGPTNCTQASVPTAPATLTASTLTSSTIKLGGSVTDTATVTGQVASGSYSAGVPTGTVDFYVCGPYPSAQVCTSTATSAGNISLTSLDNNFASATSSAFTPTAPGTYCFAASYVPSGMYNASSDNSSSADGNACFSVTPPVAASITASAPQVDAVQSVPDSAVPESALSTAPPSGAGDATAATLGSTSLSTAPIGGVLLQDLPLTTIAGQSGSTDTGLAEAATNLDQIPLSELSLTYPAPSGCPSCAGWSGVLTGTAFTLAPLEALTLGQVLLNSTASANLTAYGVTISDLGVTGSPLGSLPLNDILLANTPLSSIPLSSTDNSNPLPDWCSALTAQGSSCAAFGITGTATTVTPLELGLAGIGLSSTELSDTELSDTELSDTELSDTELSDTELSDTELSDTELSDTELSDTELSDTELSDTGIGGIELSDTELSDTDLTDTELSDTELSDTELSDTSLSSAGAASTALAGLPLSAILPGDLSNIVLCGTSCGAITLGIAAGEGQVVGGLTLGELYKALINPSATPGFDDETIAELGQLDPTYGGATLGNLLLSLTDGRNTPGWATTTLGDLLAELVDGPATPGWATTTLGQFIEAILDAGVINLTLGDLLAALEPPQSYTWQDVDLSDVPLAQDESASTTQVEPYTVTLNVAAPGGTANVTVDLPPTFAFVGSATITGPSGTSTLPPPASTSTLNWSLPSLSPGTYTISFNADAGIDLGPAAATVSASIGSTTSTGSVNVDVVDGESGHDSPSTPTQLGMNALNLGYIASPTDIDDWSVTLTQASQELSLELSNLPADYDLELFGPSEQLLGAPSQQLSPVTDTVPALDPSGTIEATPGSQDLPVTPPSGDQLYALGNVADVASLYASDAGLQTVQTPPIGPGTYIVQVSGYNGADSPQPYLLRAQVLGGIGAALSCPALPFTTNETPANETPPTSGPEPTIAQGVNTLYLIDTQRFVGADSSTGGDGSTDLAQVEADIAATNGVNGVDEAIVPVDDYQSVQDAYQTWNSDPCSVQGANGVVSAIANVVDGIRGTDTAVTSIVIIGADDQIPFARIPDGTPADNERDFASQTFAGENNVEADALADGYYFSDDPYAASSSLGVGSATLYLPTVAVGRLIETPAEIEEALTNFTSAGGVISAKDGLATGYSDFSAGATDIVANLTHAGLNVTPLIDPTSALDWTREELIGALNAESAPSVDSINAHFNFNEALSADGYNTDNDSDLFTTQDVYTNEGAYAGALLFSMGCHSGLDIDTAEVAANGIPQTPDWATTFADAGALWVANTGFGYMDSNTVAYSVALMTDFSADLGQPVTIGQALAAAKQQYAAGNALLSPYELKSMMESTLYGLPMYTLNTASTSSGSSFTPLTTGTDSSTGLTDAAVTVSLPYPGGTTPGGLSEQSGTGGSSYFQVNGANPGTQNTDFRPIEPLTTVNVTEPGLTAHGALINSLTSTDIPDFTPTVSQPEVANVSTPQAGGSAFPGTLQRVATEQTFTLSGTAQTQDLDLIAGQYLPNPSTPGQGTQRLFTNIGAEVFYNSSSNTDFTPPTIQSSSAVTGGGGTTFTVNVAPGEAAAPVDEVLVLYTTENSPGTWTALELRSNGSSWSGTETATAGGLVQYLVEAVDAAGNVAVSNDNGSNFGSTVLPSINLSGSLNTATGDYTGPVTATVSPTPSQANPMTYQLDDGQITELTSASVTVSSQGQHALVVTDSAGFKTTQDFDIATGGPVISATTSNPVTNGWVPTGTSLNVSVSDLSALVTSVGYTVSGVQDIPPLSVSSSTVSVGPFSANGTNAVTITAVDANNVTVSETVAVDVDHQAPTVSCTPPSPNSEGWFTTQVEVPCAITDSESGIAPNTILYNTYTPASATAELGTTVTTSDKGAATTSGEACNMFGVCAPVGPDSFNVDLTTPTVTISSPTATSYKLGQSVPATYSCTDPGGSGILSCSATLNGSPFTNATVPTSNSGAYSFVVTATNVAGTITTSQPLIYSVSQALPTVVLTPSPDPATKGTTSVTYSVGVSGPSGAATPTGWVSISDGTQSCTFSLTSGAGHCALTEKVGAYTVTASYEGDGNYTPAAAVVGETVVSCNGSLAGCNLSNAKLENINLAGLNLSGDNLTDANLSGDNLSGTDLAGDNLSGVNFTNADLAKANLSGANMSGDTLTGANLTGADLAGDNLSGDTLTGANLTGADLAGDNLSGLKAQGAIFTGANLNGDNLKGGAFNGDNFVGAGLSGDNLSGGNFTNALFEGDNLSGSNLSDAEFSGANLSNTDLAGANLSGSDLTNANTDGADTKGANLNGITWSNTICPDGTNSTHDKGTCVNDQ